MPPSHCSRIKTLRDHAMRGEDLEWQRVYGFIEESHVRFNHSPHIRAKVECATCHGDVTKMTVAQRAVDHTMNFCINCHKQKGASNDLHGDPRDGITITQTPDKAASALPVLEKEPLGRTGQCRLM